MKYEDDQYDLDPNSRISEHINLFEPIKPSNSKVSNQIKRKFYQKSEFDRTSLILNSGHGSESANDSFQDLIVIGYSSNLYRDDFMALKIEDKSNLIPWNGDTNLLIDRYDCRGYLYDLDPYDADLMSEEKRNPKLTNEEAEIEKLCDYERFISLEKDEMKNLGIK
jgi:hypothetical protein